MFAIAGLVSATAAAGTWLAAARISRPQKPTFETAIVRRGPLEIRLAERGNLQSGNNLTLRCGVESPTGTSILKIVEEGTYVEKDQVVVELDSSRLRDESLLQKIRLDNAEAALKIAGADAEIQRQQNESDIANGELKLELARLDLQKYEAGDYVQSRRLFDADIKFAFEYLKKARDRKVFTERLMRRGFTTTKVLRADEVGLMRSQIDMDLAIERERVFEKFTHRRDLSEKEANVGLYEAELARIKLRSQAALTQRERNLLAAKRTRFIENRRYQKYLSQIDACTIRTPRAGIVVYANEDRRRRSSGPMVYEGAVVQERQPLIELPDVSNMEVSARIHESKIAPLHEGSPALVRVDAQAEKPFHGVVRHVALVPNSGSWPNPELKEYTAIVKLTDGAEEIAALKPGMTAEVEILADRLDSVIQAPVQSFVERGGRYFAWVIEGDDNPQRREIQPGTSNDQMIEVVDGLCEGEELVLDPRSTLPVEVAALEELVPASSDLSEGSRWARRPDRTSPPAEPAPPPVTKASEEPGSDPAALPTGAAASPADGLARKDAQLLEKMKQLFGRMDTNGDQVIDKEEWRKAARALSQQSEGKSEAGGGQ